ncbi:flagellar biosynthesis regulatory protein FlaF [Mesobaculum littorinae]|uniref:Flagellar biosynthesis regulatory protein FlaF n=1 Tax=Mesobaculum littorinae TaxID=2486419 RepID=A0A438AGW4_9RHOB|nr:flagellar biosynthesis regulator FlaF [Mesobaculum littorinae]RVV97953.1 flagellar biosynthesis regulatory protein FlaF [Mesobaculum littorinae]
MNAYHQAQTAYAPATAPVRTDRSVEYEAIARITRHIKQADENRSLVTALHENRRLWTILAVDVAGNDNALPEALRAQLFYLAEFTFQHTSKVIAGKADRDVLIEINTAVMKGLRSAKEAA